MTFLSKHKNTIKFGLINEGLTGKTPLQEQIGKQALHDDLHSFKGMGMVGTVLRTTRFPYWGSVERAYFLKTRR
jgi:hypothetical protein